MGVLFLLLGVGVTAGTYAYAARNGGIYVAYVGKYNWKNDGLILLEWFIWFNCLLCCYIVLRYKSDFAVYLSVVCLTT